MSAADLAWLPEAPADFRKRLQSLAQSPEPVGGELRQLATHRLTGTQLARLAKTIGGLQAEGRSLAPLAPLRLGVLGNGTLDMIIPALVASAARHGVALECVAAAYGQYAQAALSPDSAINAAACDAVLLALDYRALGLDLAIGSAAQAEEAVAAALDMLGAFRRGIRASANAACILQTIAPPPEPLFGAADRTIPGTPRHLADAFNRRLAESISGTPDLLLDVAGIAEQVGLAEWHSPAQWNLAKLPFSDDCTPLYADCLARLLGALRGKSRRVLVLDLDNTVWGGVIGDDGPDGIKLAEGDAEGEAFRAVQRYALALRERGVLLAVSSKNTDEIARAVFRDHPDMLLHERHVTAFQANWSDKATNIKAIAEELSLGLESMVFLDDNPAERGLVRQALPEVAVPELPPDPALYARTLAQAGYFEALTFSDEDRKRNAFYEGNARRVALQREVGDIDAYLASLDMEITFAPFDAAGRTRIAQLINKSNQFNLTTRRYTEAEVAAAEADPDVFTLQIRLKDRFGDNGMICAVICRPDGPDWLIDTWLMSCRVLGRRVEQMTLREIALAARERGVGRLIGVYKPTARNALVRDHYKSLGFQPVSADADGAAVWSLDTATETPGAAMLIHRPAELAA